MSPCGFRKVFSKLSFHVPAEVVRKIVMSTAGFIEPVLCTLRERIESKRMDRVSDNMQVCMRVSVCVCVHVCVCLVKLLISSSTSLGSVKRWMLQIMVIALAICQVHVSQRSVSQQSVSEQVVLEVPLHHFLLCHDEFVL